MEIPINEMPKHLRKNYEINNETELKPCPFCGGNAHFFRYVSRNDKGVCSDYVHIKCESCLASSQSIEYDARIHGESGEYDEVRELWNRRVENG